MTWVTSEVDKSPAHPALVPFLHSRIGEGRITVFVPRSPEASKPAWLELRGLRPPEAASCGWTFFTFWIIFSCIFSTREQALSHTTLLLDHVKQLGLKRPSATISSAPEHKAHAFTPSYSTSRSTQLSAGTLRLQHYRSKGVQVTDAIISRETNKEDAFTRFSSASIETASVNGVRPPKRSRVELEEEDDDDVLSMSGSAPQDSTYGARETAADLSDVIEMEKPYDFEDAKYIVFESALRELFENCPVCKKHCIVHQRKCGTFVAFSQCCPHCSFTRKWQSQPMKGKIPQGNLELSAAVYFNGGSFKKIKRICSTMNLRVHQYCTYRKHAQQFLQPAVFHKWKVDQHKLLEEIKRKEKVAVIGDMRADSQGDSAKFGSYTIMELEESRVLDIQLVQSNEVGSSVNMEKEGLKRCLDLLESSSVSLDYIVTDRHPQVQNYLREREISHYYDVWHVANGLSKKLDALAKKKDCEIVKKWLPSIKNHLYWTVSSSTTGAEKIAKWTSLMNHIQDVHEHDHPFYPKCLHPVKVSKDRNKWFKPGTLTVKVEKILMNKRILKDVCQLSKKQPMPSLESFHSLILRFAPKNVNFSFIGLLCRLYLAALHQNENGKREQAMAKEKLLWKLGYPKSIKGQTIARPIKTNPTFAYRSDLIQLVLNEVLADPRKFQKELEKVPVPPTISSLHEGPSKKHVVAVQT
ncbi:uncharacterized protein LOC130917124 [Corythoichthys intestinalis]|uniref:uncharacterized protein LOC130917124 n=1 Tax=Corythoichthys intestinalis TaxID=161448 RepID=UPI0025A5E1C7|nr:uncharacterized protein LOC130917124 [Corythoichthys intestinalis]